MEMFIIVGSIMLMLCCCSIPSDSVGSRKKHQIPFPQSWKWKTTLISRKLIFEGPIFHFHVYTWLWKSNHLMVLEMNEQHRTTSWFKKWPKNLYHLFGGHVYSFWKVSLKTIPKKVTKNCQVYECLNKKQTNRLSSTESSTPKMGPLQIQISKLFITLRIKEFQGRMWTCIWQGLQVLKEFCSFEVPRFLGCLILLWISTSPVIDLRFGRVHFVFFHPWSQWFSMGPIGHLEPVNLSHFSRKVQFPGNSTCDLFGIVKWPELKGCWWPPTFGDQKVTAWITWFLILKKTLSPQNMLQPHPVWWLWIREWSCRNLWLTKESHRINGTNGTFTY